MSKITLAAEKVQNGTEPPFSKLWYKEFSSQQFNSTTRFIAPTNSTSHSNNDVKQAADTRHLQRPHFLWFRETVHEVWVLDYHGP